MSDPITEEDRLVALLSALMIRQGISQIVLTVEEMRSISPSMILTTSEREHALTATLHNGKGELHDVSSLDH